MPRFEGLASTAKSGLTSPAMATEICRLKDQLACWLALGSREQDRDALPDAAPEEQERAGHVSVGEESDFLLLSNFAGHLPAQEHFSSMKNPSQ